MKAKTIVTVVLLAFVAVSVGYLIIKELRPEKAGPPAGGAGVAAGAESPEAEAAAPAPHHVRVAYFYFGKRCATCLKLEKYSREAVDLGFPEEVAAGKVVWEAVDTDEPANRHYNEDYELYAKAIIVSEMRDGEETRWKNLAQVWQLTRDREAFYKYVRDEVREYLREVE